VHHHLLPCPFSRPAASAEADLSGGLACIPELLGPWLADIDHPRHAELVNAHAELVAPDLLLHAVLVLGEAVRSRRALQLEQERSERLLLNVLPAPIAVRSKPVRR
jgi:hypothetical protein